MKETLNLISSRLRAARKKHWTTKVPVWVLWLIWAVGIPLICIVSFLLSWGIVCLIETHDKL